MAVTQPGGVGTTIYIYDNAGASNGLNYTFAEISTAFPADFVDNGTAQKSYRAKVNLQVGDTGVGTAATTLSDTNVTVTFDATKQLAYRTTQLSSWTTTLGIKTGSGNLASGRSGCNIFTSGTTTTIRGNIQLYGCKIVATGRLVVNPSTTGLTCDVVNCLLESTGTGVISGVDVGSATVSPDNLYNVDFTGAATTLAGLVNVFNATAAERMTFGGNPIAYIRSSSASIAMKDAAFFGTPITADIVWLGAGVQSNWVLVRPKWSGNAARFAGTATSNDPANGTHEYWGFDVKTVDRNGAAVSGIPVKLTDSTGAIQVNTTTNAVGQATYGSGITANFAIVRDHYLNASAVYTTRDRSPFLVEINTGPSANSSYPGMRYNFDWPGLSTGNFEDISDIIPLQYASGGPTTWTEYELGAWP